MKNGKLSLNQLSVSSFVTKHQHTGNVRGGAAEYTQEAESSCIEFNCTVQCEGLEEALA
ncbi:pinensin family lanthipeptide [Roseivirga sp. BDSF3-8]|uniref:pinensin family lanthipeptide n=1 Tax=Roseivirga sp. BDSF3-8 TaxID=3241598 RepID=UPI00353203E8